MDASILQHSHGPRENDDAQRLRRVHKDDPKTLRHFGYHGTIPFTERHVFTSIYDALAPDLLHQVSKCFYDYVHQWVLAIIGDQTPDALRKRKRTNTTGTKPSKRKTRGEIDARFSQLPPYPGLRSFREGISLTSRWQGNEFKNMLKVYLGVIVGLVPSDIIRLVKAYLDVHRLAHYVSHSESTIRMLESAIQEFERLLHDPQGTIMSQQVRPEGWYCPKMHYLRHYPEWIRRHGPLPYCSTDQSENYHKNIKASYRQSNKGADSERFCVRDEARRFAWNVWKQQLPHMTVSMSPNDTLANESLGEHRDIRQIYNGTSGVKTAEFLPKTRWKGLRELRIVAEEVGHPALVQETLRYLRWHRLGRTQTVRRGAAITEQYPGRVELRGYLGVNLTYPTVYDANINIEECVRCDPLWVHYQDKDWIKSREDTVLLRFTNEESEDSVMKNKKVARLLLLFSLTTQTNERHDLALVQLFGMSSSVDVNCAMYKVKKTTTYEVIEIATIEQGVHLIPVYHNKTDMATANSTPALDMYSEFWLNNQVNLHKFNSIY